MKAIVLDLDNTLLYTSNKKDIPEYNKYKLDFGDEVLYGEWRNGIKYFLTKLDKYFDIYIWSAGEYEYVHKIVELLNNIIYIPKDKVLTRDDCVTMLTKDRYKVNQKPLSIFFNKVKDKELNYKNTIIIDDREDVCEENISNHIKILEFKGIQDEELIKLADKLIKNRNINDVFDINI